MPWHILYLEPSSGMRRAMQLAWLGQPAQVSAVADLAAASIVAGELPIDLILVAHPGAAGPTVATCGSLRQLCAAQRPALGLVAHPSAALDAPTLTLCGASGLVHKPLQVEAMLASCRQWLQQRRPLPARGSVWQGPPPAAPPGGVLPPAQPQTLLLPTVGDGAAVGISSAPDQLQQMARQAVEAAAWQLVPAIAETLVRRALETRAKA